MEFGGLKVLMISSDRNILTPLSAVSFRMKEYGALVEELHIVLLCDSEHGLKEGKLEENVWVYPTNSMTSFLRPLGASKLGKRIVKNKNFIRGKSLIAADSLECGWAGIKIKNKWRIPLEVQLHTDPFSPYFKGFQNTVRRLLSRRILSDADSIRVVSSSLGEKVLKEFQFPKDKVFILPIYIDKQRIVEGKVSFDLHARLGWHFILLSVARLTVEKNLQMAIEILSQVRQYYPDTGLVIVGSGPEETNLKSLAKKFNVEGHVHFAGWQEDLASYYKTANMFLQTSNFEGYGLALVEAGLSGLPVVTTEVGIAQELRNGEDAYITPVGDIETMFKAVYDLIKDNAKREILKSNLKRTLETKLLSKEEYLKQLKANWGKAALMISG